MRIFIKNNNSLSEKNEYLECLMSLNDEIKVTCVINVINNLLVICLFMRIPLFEAEIRNQLLLY